jgi:hypothetical protein
MCSPCNSGIGSRNAAASHSGCRLRARTGRESAAQHEPAFCFMRCGSTHLAGATDAGWPVHHRAVRLPTPGRSCSRIRKAIRCRRRRRRTPCSPTSTRPGASRYVAALFRWPHHPLRRWRWMDAPDCDPLRLSGNRASAPPQSFPRAGQARPVVSASSASASLTSRSACRRNAPPLNALLASSIAESIFEHVFNFGGRATAPILVSAGFGLW